MHADHGAHSGLQSGDVERSVVGKGHRNSPKAGTNNDLRTWCWRTARPLDEERFDGLENLTLAHGLVERAVRAGLADEHTHGACVPGLHGVDLKGCLKHGRASEVRHLSLEGRGAGVLDGG